MANVVLKINIDLPGLTKDLDKVLAQIKGKLSDVGEVQIEAETSDAIREVNKLENAVENVDDTAKQTSATFTDWATIFTGLNQGLELLGKVVEVISKPIEDAGQFEQYEAALTVMLGSANKAKDRLQELVDFAANTPFELPQVVEAANQLQAVGKYSEETLTILGDLASASGKSFDQVLSAYAKMASGQKGIAIDMFRDLLITTNDWAKATGKQIGKNGELQASVEEMAEALPKIIKEKGFSGMMKVQSETMNGMKSNFEDSLGKLSVVFGKMLLPITKELTKIGTEFVNSLIPVETHLDRAKDKAFQQRFAFEKLVQQYEQLRAKSNLTNIEQKTFSGLITELQNKYPTFLKNLDLQKGKLDDVRKGFKGIREEIERNIIIELRKAEVEDKLKAILALDDERRSREASILNEKTTLELMNQGKIQDKTLKDIALTRSNISTPALRKESDEIKVSITANEGHIKIIDQKIQQLVKEKNALLELIPIQEESNENIDDGGDKTEKLIKTKYIEIDAKQRDAQVTEATSKYKIGSEIKYTKVVQDEEKKRIAAWAAEREARAELLQQTIAAGIASAQAEENLGKQLANIARNTIKRLIAEGIAYQLRHVFMEIPFPFSVIAAAAAAETIGVLVDSLLPKFGEGGHVVGKKHKDGGKTINVEGGEYIFDAETVGREPQNFDKLHKMLKSGELTLYDLMNPVLKKTSGLDVGIIPKLSSIDITDRAANRNTFANSEIETVIQNMNSKLEELFEKGMKIELELIDGELRITNEAIYKGYKFREKIESKRKVG